MQVIVHALNEIEVWQGGGVSYLCELGLFQFPGSRAVSGDRKCSAISDKSMVSLLLLYQEFIQPYLWKIFHCYKVLMHLYRECCCGCGNQSLKKWEYLTLHFQPRGDSVNILGQYFLSCISLCSINYLHKPHKTGGGLQKGLIRIGRSSA